MEFKKYLSIFDNEFRSHYKWVLSWIIGIFAYNMLIVFMYPGEDALYDFLDFYESQDAFVAILGQISGENPSIRLWISIMYPFTALAFFIFSLMLGVKLTTSAISNETGELIHTQPVHRPTFLAVRFVFGLISILFLMIIDNGMLRIPFTGEFVPLANIWTISWWGFLYLIAMMSVGMSVGSLTADTGKGNMFALIVSLSFYGLQIMGNILPELANYTNYIPLNWYLPGQAIVNNKVSDESLWYIVITLFAFVIIANILFYHRDLIKEASIPIPILTAWSRRRETLNGGKSDRDRLIVSWAKLLEKRFPFTSDFIFSERKVLLVTFWAVVVFYPFQLMLYSPNDPEFILGLESTMKSWGSSGILKLFTYGHDLTGKLFLWFIITQAIGNHYFIFVPLVAHWIKKIIAADSEHLTAEIYGSIPIQPYKVLLQRLFAVIIELFFIVIQMVLWLIISEAVVSTSYNQMWEIIAIISIIPLYWFLITAGLSLGILFKDGVKYARYILIGLVMWFIAGITSDFAAGLFGLYDPVLIILEQSLFVVNYGVVWLTVLAIIFTMMIFMIAPQFDWLRITPHEQST